MVLVLDACTISYLVNVFQDDSLIKHTKKAFTQVYVCSEVINEVNNNKFSYLDLYDSKEHVLQLLADINLRELLSDHDRNKSECKPLIRKFSAAKGLALREMDGEFHCALLSLYLSRWGQEDFNEQINSVLFATDDEGAKELYSQLVAHNQVGVIVDSVDIVVILHLKALITKSTLIRYIEGLINLHRRGIGILKGKIEAVKKLERGNAKHELALTSLMELLTNAEIDELKDSLYNHSYKTLFKKYDSIKTGIKELELGTQRFNYLKERRIEVIDDLIWKIS
jgi:hypothetical protein